METRELTTSDWALMGVLCVGAFVALVYVPFGWTGIANALIHPATAAWVQAIGSVLAIIAAVVLARGDAQERHRSAAINAFVVASRIKASVHLVLQTSRGLESTYNIRSKTAGDYCEKVGRMVERIDSLPTIPAADVAALASASGITAANLGSALDRLGALRNLLAHVIEVRSGQVPMAQGAHIRGQLTQIIDLLVQASAHIEVLAKHPPRQ